MCSAIDSHTVRTATSSTPWSVKKRAAASAPVDFEALVSAAVLGHAKVVQQTAEEDELVVVIDPGPQAVGGGQFAPEQVTPDAVVGQKRKRDFGHQLQCS